MSFRYAIQDRFGKDAKEFAEKLFENMSLPLPGAGEFYETHISSGKLAKVLVFLRRHQITLRFYEPYTIPFHDNILQPLVKSEAGRMDVDIAPMIETGVSTYSLHEIEGNLGKERIEWGDNAVHNAGYLGAHHPVVLDICESLQYGLGCHFNKIACPIQETVYGSLSSLAQKMLKTHGMPDPGMAKIFLSACKDFAGNNSLYSMANNNALERQDGQTTMAMRAAHLYQQRLEACH